MNIFVTGSESFVGKRVLNQLKKNGHSIVGVDLAPPSQENCHSIDISSPALAELIPEGADAVIHLAALSRDPDCKNRALECFQANVMGTLNLVQAAERRKAKQFIFASSEWVYDFVNDDEKTEDSAINLRNLTSEYALSKLVTENNLRQKFQHGFCPTTILRFGIVYGPRPSNWSAVESVFNSVATKDEITVGCLKTARRFIHVDDIASGILASIGLPGYEIINLQGEKLISLGDIVEVGSKLLGRKVKATEKDPQSPSIRRVSGEKALRLLNWKPKIDLATGLGSLKPFIKPL